MHVCVPIICLWPSCHSLFGIDNETLLINKSHVDQRCLIYGKMYFLRVCALDKTGTCNVWSDRVNLLVFGRTFIEQWLISQWFSAHRQLFACTAAAWLTVWL